jgi:hypothetical protein
MKQRTAQVFEIYSRDGKYGALCLVEPIDNGYYRWQVMRMRTSISGAQPNIDTAISEAHAVARADFLRQRQNDRIARAIDILRETENG